MKSFWGKILNFYAYSLFAAPFAMLLLMSGNPDYIINKILTFYFLCAIGLAFILWPVISILEWKKRKVQR